MKKLIITILVAGVFGAVSACDSNERTATAETSVAEAEVTTTMPEAAVSDAQLEASANRAAANASQPAPGTMTPGGVPATQGADTP